MSRRPSLIIALLAVLVLAAACSPSAGPLGSPASPALTPTPADEPTPSDVAPGTQAPTPAPTEAPTAVPTEPPSGESTPKPTSKPTPTPKPSASTTDTSIVRAYFMLGSLTGNPGLVPTLREVPKTQAVGRAAMTQLLDGPKGAELEVSPAMYTSIPEGTRLIDLQIANSRATVTLSSEFGRAAANFQQGVAAAQVVYTLTQFSSVDEVTIVIEGGASQRALTRADFQLVGILPAIFVDRPAWGAAAGNPMRVAGLANVFEATFQVQVLDGKGRIIADKAVTATCGTGCWGSFKTDVPYSIAKAQYGTLRVFNSSAKDGSPENVTEYRVWLTTAG
jgi:hypothetical protein